MAGSTPREGTRLDAKRVGDRLRGRSDRRRHRSTAIRLAGSVLRRRVTRITDTLDQTYRSGIGNLDELPKTPRHTFHCRDFQRPVRPTDNAADLAESRHDLRLLGLQSGDT